jgi:energy-coupling factor transporter ATP-binding protein EcfA2
MRNLWSKLHAIPIGFPLLTSLHLENFRAFADHTLALRRLTIVVGRNNAGKSTIVEALRLVALITRRFRNLNFRGVPTWLNVPRIYRGVTPDLSYGGFNFETVFHRYGDPPAVVTAAFDNGVKISMYIGGNDLLHAVIFDSKGRPIHDKAQARRVDVPLVSILPQISPLPDNEELLNEDYVRRTLDSHLASLHFRNQLKLDFGAYRRFRQMVEDSWPGVRIRELNTIPVEAPAPLPPTNYLLSLLVQNDDFVAEVSRMGHGLQMWLQTIWFLARTPSEATVILDEPDVYMHPDLQRRLVRLIEKLHKQTIIATHSTEIMADVGPEDILVIEKNASVSEFASSIPDVQEVIDSLGGVQNLHLARLWSSKRFLIVEGDDLEILGPIHQKLFPESVLPLQTIPHGEVGGWGGWERAVGGANAVRRAFGSRVSVYAIFDSDYQPINLIMERYERASKNQIRLHIWGKKEIENYLLVPTAIQRLIASRTKGHFPSVEEISSEINRIVSDLRRDVTGAMIDTLNALYKDKGAGSAYKVADSWCESAWQTTDGQWGIVSGKAVISELSKWSEARYKVSFGPVALARTMKESEVVAELREVLTAIEQERQINPTLRVDPTPRP